jgi:hypothetical protein
MLIESSPALQLLIVKVSFNCIDAPAINTSGGSAKFFNNSPTSGTSFAAVVPLLTSWSTISTGTSEQLDPAAQRVAVDKRAPENALTHVHLQERRATTERPKRTGDI